MVQSLLTEIWARELATQSEAHVEVSGAALDTLYSVDVTPPVGHKALVVHRFTFGLPLTTERGTPVADVRRLATSSITYGTAATLTVPAAPARYRIREISLNSNDFARTNWRLTIGGVEQFADLVILSALTLNFSERNYLGGAEQVLLEAASTDGTAIVVNGEIAAELYYPYDWQIWVEKRGLYSERHNTYFTDDLIKDGADTWIYVTDGEPLSVEIKKLYGRGSDHFMAHIWIAKVGELGALEEIKKLALERGVQERLPFGPESGRRLPAGVR